MLQITARTGDRVTARLPDHVELEVVPALRAIGDRLIDEGCRHLVLDASDTVRLDSDGVALLLAWYRRLERLEGTLSLTGVGEPPLSLLLRLGLDGVLGITPGAGAGAPDAGA
ncbi:STAS domain-containing protein [Streptomyces sp. NPDC097619]|uniref:STAS domain-containing protein n=1 Tax=Streptomyces sp. NPDC097619 TaxID=3157228 RepID=UPI00331F0EBD